MDLATRRRLHRVRKGHDCPNCHMHFGWKKQFDAHIRTCKPEPTRKPTAVKIGLRYSR